MYRYLQGYLKKWLEQKNRKPLILRGARQVGKSTLVKQFATQEKLKLIEINFEKKIFPSFRSSEINMEKIILEIETSFNCSLNKDTLIFLDEIQKCPEALKVLRYFYEEYSFIPIIAAGSLLEFVLEDTKIEIPVGRIEYLYMGPMSFSEFLLAQNKNKLVEVFTNSRKQIENILNHDNRDLLNPSQLNSSFFPQGVFELLTEEFKTYLYVGGMPEAVKVYAETKDLNLVRKVQNSIISTYKDDFHKYAKKSEVARMDIIFEKLPIMVGKKMKYSELDSDMQSRDIKKVLHLLKLARVIHFCHHTHCSGFPLSASKDMNTFKIYFLDVGLYYATIGVRWSQLQSDLKNENLAQGTAAEQFVAQHLAYSSDCSGSRNLTMQEPNLMYWLRDKGSSKAEVDFVLDLGQQVLPIEVKSGKTGQLRSVKQMALEKSLVKKIVRFDLKYRDKIIEEFEPKKSLINLHIACAEWIHS